MTESVLAVGKLAPEFARRVAARRPALRVETVERWSGAEETLARVDAVVAFHPPPSGLPPNVRWVHCMGAGVDSWLSAPAALTENVPMTRTVGRMGLRMAEYCVTRAYVHCQNVHALKAQQRERTWRPLPLALLAGTRAIVFGAGAVGGEIARLFAANGCEVFGVTRSPGESGHFRNLVGLEAGRRALPECDWILLATPLTNETHGFFGAAFFARCKADAFLVNVARGGILDAEALLTALDGRRLAGAALDVLPEEPLPPESPLWAHPRIDVTPHLSGLTDASDAAEDFLAALQELEAGRRPEHLVDRGRGY